MKTIHRFLTLLGLLAFLLLCLVPSGQAQSCVPVSQSISASWQLGLTCTFTSASTPYGAFNAKSIVYWQVFATPSGTVSSATLSIDSSATGTSWTTGGIIPSASIGSLTAAATYQNPTPTTPTNYAQLTPAITGSGTLTVTVLGYSTNPTKSQPWIDASVYLTSSGDACAAINTALNAATNLSNGVLVDAGSFATIGDVPCLSNPFHNFNKGGKLRLGATRFVTSVPWVTPNLRFSIDGTGGSNPGGGNFPNSTIQACASGSPGWNGTACVVNGVTVPAFGSSGDSLSFTYPHGPMGAGTYYPLLWVGSQGSSTTTCATDSFGGFISNLTLDANSVADFAFYTCSEQEDSGLFNVVQRNTARACAFWDGVQGGSNDSGPTHYSVYGGECRMSTSVSAAEGYPVQAAQQGMGYGYLIERNADVVWFSGSNCSRYPQGYPNISGGAVSSITMTYVGSCSAAPTCNVSTAKAGSGATCHANYAGGVVTSISVDAGGSGYATGDILGAGPFYMGGMTINGTAGGSANMWAGITVSGTYNNNIGSLHCEWLIDSCVHDGDGNGPIQVGTIHNIDLANSGSYAIHVGKGIDNNQVLTSFKGGSVGPLLDDQNGITLAAATWGSGVEQYQAGGQNNPNGITLGASQDVGINRTAADALCFGNGTGAATNANIDCSATAKASTFLGDHQFATPAAHKVIIAEGAATNAVGVGASAVGNVIVDQGVSADPTSSAPAYLSMFAWCNATFPTTSGTNTYSLGPFETAVTSNSCTTLTTGTGTNMRSPVTTIAGKCNIAVNAGVNASASGVIFTLNNVTAATSATVTLTSVNNNKALSQSLAITAGDVLNVTATTQQASEPVTNPRVSVFCW